MRATDAADAATRAASIAVRLPGHRPRPEAGTAATAAVTAPAGGASLRPSGLPYLAGLDGLRALAVIAVVLYHAGVDFIPAGFLGVEIFFVISGYLITSLLLSEHAATSAVSLRRFWMRRARRLLPALFLLVAVVLTYFAIFLPGEVATVRGDALAAVAYVSNWAFILRDTPYFEQVGRPSPLLHLWSLAIEEQFYVIWPPLFVGLMALRGRALLFAAIVAGIVGSSVLMAVLYEPFADVSRVYYGTDTRAAGLLFGAALAVVWRAGALPAPRGRVVAWLFYASGLARLLRLSLDIAGLAALAGLAYIVVTFNSFQPALYLGGFALVSGLTVIVIAAAVTPGGRLGRVLGVAPLRAVGLRSYSIYLWHWPIFVVTRPGIDVHLGEIELLAVRLALTLLLAEISYRFVEMPIRHGALGRIWARTRTRRGWARQLRRGVIIGPALSGAVALGVVVAVAPAAEPPSYLATERISTIRVVAAVEAEPVDAAPPETESADAGVGEAEAIGSGRAGARARIARAGVARPGLASRRAAGRRAPRRGGDRSGSAGRPAADPGHARSHAGQLDGRADGRDRRADDRARRRARGRRGRHAQRSSWRATQRRPWHPPARRGRGRQRRRGGGRAPVRGRDRSSQNGRGGDRSRGRSTPEGRRGGRGGGRRGAGGRGAGGREAGGRGAGGRGTGGRGTRGRGAGSSAGGLRGGRRGRRDARPRAPGRTSPPVVETAAEPAEPAKPAEPAEPSSRPSRPRRPWRSWRSRRSRRHRPPRA